MSKNGGFISELRRRRVFRNVALYIVAAWATLQVADLAFPGLEIPESAIRYVWIWAFGCFPVALLFAWRFDIVGGRIVRTPDSVAEEYPALNRTDYALLSVLTVAVVAFSFGIVQSIFDTRSLGPNRVISSTIDPKSIAVLPFTNMSGDATNEPFTMGIHDDLLTHISKISDLKVISRTSVARLDTSMSIPAIGELLQVAAVLEGGLQRMGDRVRINVQLIESATDQHMWAESFDRELTTENIFAIQSDIAAAITEKLRAILSPRDEANLNKMPTQNLAAFEAYLLGKQKMTTRTRPELVEANGYFHRAVELDPEYALAWVGLADTNMILNAYGHLPIDETLAIAEPALANAVALDDQLGAAYASIGMSLVRQGDITGGEAAYERAIALDPNYATTYHWYGDTLLNITNDLKTALPLLEKARELDPLSPVINMTLGEILTGLGRHEEALAQYQKTIEIEPDYPSAYFMIATHYRAVSAQLDESIRWHQKEIVTAPGRDSSILGMAYLDIGDDIKAEYWINRGVSMHPEWYFPHVGRAFLQRYRGEEALALEAARDLQDLFPGNNTSLVTLVNYGHYEETLEIAVPAYPELACSTDPVISLNNMFQAMNLSLALEQTGQRECSDRMLENILEQLNSIPRLGGRGYGILDVEVYARQGKTRLALDTLRQAVDAGWRLGWWAQGEGSPHLISLLEEPEFKAMMDEIRAEMAVQLAHLREMEAAGELPVVPDITPE